MWGGKRHPLIVANAAITGVVWDLLTADAADDGDSPIIPDEDSPGIRNTVAYLIPSQVELVRDISRDMSGRFD